MRESIPDHQQGMCRVGRPRFFRLTTGCVPPRSPTWHKSSRELSSATAELRFDDQFEVLDPGDAAAAHDFVSEFDAGDEFVGGEQRCLH